MSQEIKIEDFHEFVSEALLASDSNLRKKLVMKTKLIVTSPPMRSSSSEVSFVVYWKDKFKSCSDLLSLALDTYNKI